MYVWLQLIICIRTYLYVLIYIIRHSNMYTVDTNGQQFNPNPQGLKEGGSKRLTSIQPHIISFGWSPMLGRSYSFLQEFWALELVGTFFWFKVQAHLFLKSWPVCQESRLHHCFRSGQHGGTSRGTLSLWLSEMICFIWISVSSIMGCQSHWWTWHFHMSMFQGSCHCLCAVGLDCAKIGGWSEKQHAGCASEGHSKNGICCQCEPCFQPVLSKNPHSKTFHDLLVLVFESWRSCSTLTKSSTSTIFFDSCEDRTVPDSAVSALVICSDGCFKQFQFGVTWLNRGRGFTSRASRIEGVKFPRCFWYLSSYFSLDT